MKFFKTKNIILSIVGFGAYFKTTEAVVYHADRIEDGAVLHAFSWSFNTIKAKLPDIRKAGYTAIQTSPIQECLVGNGGSKYFGNWEFEYQPISQNIGNYIVGTEDEFKSLCAAAKQYGIKIVVDAVLNHMTTDLRNCAPEWRDPGLYHEARGIDNWNDRYQVTQRDLVGLRDIRTQNPDYQQKALNMLKRIISDGASGFRYDTAKHIELPDDPGYGSQFWPTVLNNGAEFQYGEVLQDGISRDSAYAKYMKITASNYGNTVISAVNDNNFSTDRIMNYNADVNPNRLITWVESHDNYANSDKKTVYLTNEKIKLAWALITARKSTTPLFFSRPLGGGGGNAQFPGRSQLGDEGDPLYKDDAVAAVNLFRNAMVGQDEYLRNPNGDSKILMIERGKKGVVIINLNYGQSSLNSVTNLADGEYENQTNDNSRYKVSGGRITGTLLARSITVLYKDTVTGPTVGIEGYSNDSEIPFKSNSLKITLTATNASKATYSINGQSETTYSNGRSITIGANSSVGSKITVTLSAQGSNNTSTRKVYTFVKMDPNAVVNIYFRKPSSWGTSINAYIYTKSGSSTKSVATWPGKAMTKINSDTYSITVDGDYEGGMVIFNDNRYQSPGSNEDGFKVVNNGLYGTNGYISSYSSGSGSGNGSGNGSGSGNSNATSNKVYFEKPSSWGSNINAYIYMQKGSVVSEVSQWPGKRMNNEGNNIYSIEISSGYDGAYIIFNDGSRQAPSSGASGFVIRMNYLYNVNGLSKKY